MASSYICHILQSSLQRHVPCVGEIEQRDFKREHYTVLATRT